jgi:hypothetical protein
MMFFPVFNPLYVYIGDKNVGKNLFSPKYEILSFESLWRRIRHIRHIRLIRNNLGNKSLLSLN